MRKYIAEFIGTFTLVFFGCATIIFMREEVGLLGVAFAFGLSVVAMAYAVGPISGAHLNPAVSLGAVVAGRLSVSDFIGYVVAQFLGGIVAAAVLYVIASGRIGGFDAAANGFAQNGWTKYGMLSAFIFEATATFLFLTVILSATQQGASAIHAGLVIGLTLVAIHLAGIAVSGASVNPARSFGPALFAGASAMSQVWLYFVAPCVGAILAGTLFRMGVTRHAPVAA